MKLVDFTTKLQALCHDGYALAEVEIDMDGNNEQFADIEIRRLFSLEEGGRKSVLFRGENNGD